MAHSFKSTRHNGFSLLEVLVAMIILSIGLLALTALQLNSLKTTNEAQQITNVALAAKEMADRMRANPTELVRYAGTAITEASDTAPNCAPDGNTCTAAQLREFDVNEWIRPLEKTMSLVRGSIYQTVGTPDEYTISIQWDADRDGELAAAGDCDQSYVAGNPVAPAGCYKLRFSP